MIRITQSMQVARTLLDQNLNLQRMNEYSNNMSSRYNLHRPSDDPIRVARAMRLQTELRVNETYKENLQSSESWTSKTDVTLTTLSDIIKRVRELTVQAASEDKTTEDKQKIRSEIEQLKKSAIQIGNDDYMGRYQFSGYKTNKKFVNENGKYNTELDLAGLRYEKINYNIGVGQKTEINFSGVEVFGNEYFTTKTRAIDTLPFTDETESVLGAKMTIKLQKYKQPDHFYDKVPANLHTQSGAANEDKLNNEKEEKYEKTKKLTDTIGTEIVLNDISFFGSYKKDDINAVIEDLNKSLREKIDKHVEGLAGLTATQKADLKKELSQAAQFVNDDGKISFVTDRDYSGKIEPDKLDLKEINTVKKTSVQTPNNNTVIQINTPLDYSNNTVKVYFNFDLALTEYEKNANGDIDTALPKTPNIELKGITLSKEYKKGTHTNQEIAKLIAADLQTQINSKLMQKNMATDTVKVVVDPITNQPQIVLEREYGSKINNIIGGIPTISSTIAAPLTYTPNENPRNNTVKETDLQIDLSTKPLGENGLLNLNLDLKLTQYKNYSSVGGDILISNPGVGAIVGAVPPGKEGFLAIGDPNYPEQLFDLGSISINKIYSGKNADGSDKDNNTMLREIAADIQAKIGEKASSHNPPIDTNKINVQVKNGKISLIIDGNLKSEINNLSAAITQNTFNDNQNTPMPDIKSVLTIPMPALNPNEDAHIYMNLNIDIEKFAKDEYGNSIPTKKLSPKIEMDKLTINKTYSRKKPDGSDYTDAEIKKLIFDDVKSKIEERLSQLNPPLDKKAINVSFDGTNINISVYPDIEVSVYSDTQKPSSIESQVGYIPKQDTNKEPEREMMPFFEMMDRLMKFMDEGNSKGLSRMIDVIDYHAKNNQKNQGIGGGRSNMYKIMLERTEDVKLNYSQLRSETIETDYSETSMKMMVAQYVYRASLAVTAKIIQPSLVDFLK